MLVHIVKIHDYNERDDSEIALVCADKQQAEELVRNIWKSYLDQHDIKYDPNAPLEKLMEPLLALDHGYDALSIVVETHLVMGGEKYIRERAKNRNTTTDQ